MAARVNGLFDEETKNSVLNSKVLVVGAGGIGCELLKDLVLTGFEDIHVIDLDTIDVSNLNRQFLFHKQHVGRSKAVVAKESAEKLNRKSKITAYHDSITNTKYEVEFFQQFSAVTNALDNMAARSHVNRMCLAANIPLIESGSAGYFGQVTVYKKKLTECYECLPRLSAKTYPSCTIRNTPSEPVHCVVWGKHLFNQLFGEEDADQEVSPDAADKEILHNDMVETGILVRESTREWAKNSEYDPVKIFKKLFHDDIQYLLSMTDLWAKRKPPSPLEWDDLPDAVAGSSQQSRSFLKDQELWSIKECAAVFQSSLAALKKAVDRQDSDGILIWDKDDKHCVDFVTACANIRAYCFGIPQFSRFEVKSMAGNIIPAIATTNAIIAGLIVLQLLKVLKGQIEKCRTVVLSKCANHSPKNLLTACELVKPNPKCFACSPIIPMVEIWLNLRTLTLRTLMDKVLIERLNMIAPDAIIDNGRGSVVISSDPEEMHGNHEKTLSDYGVSDGCRLQVDDFNQRFKLVLLVRSSLSLSDQEFEINSDLLKSVKADVISTDDAEDSESEPTIDPTTNIEIEVGNACVTAATSSSRDESIIEVENSAKRKLSDDENGMESLLKKTRADVEAPP